MRHMTRRWLVLAAAGAIVLPGCGGGDGNGGGGNGAAGGAASSGTPGQSTSKAPSSKQTKAAGIPSSHSDQKEYFMRVYCIGDRPAQCKCKLDVMGSDDEKKFAEVLYRLKTNDQATVIRFGRATTGCA